MDNLRRQLSAAKKQQNTQAARIANAEQEVKNRATELERAKAKEKKLFLAINASHRNQNEILANLKRQYDEGASKYFGRVEAMWRKCSMELALAKQERDQSQETLTECAEIIKSLNSKLNGGKESA